MKLRRRTFLTSAAASVAFPVRAETGDTLRIAVISDLNGSYGSTEYAREVTVAVEQIIHRAPHLVICTGDMIAGQRASPKLTEAELTTMWNAFHAVVTDPLSAAGIPMLVTPGNHDASAYPGFERERQVFDRVWTARAPDLEILDGERFPFRFAAACKDVLLVGLDITVTGPLDVEEAEWLKQMLFETRGQYRATIVFGHLPIWPVSVGRESQVIGDINFEALLSDGNAGLYLSGHHHAFYPGRSGGLLQVTQGCLGDGPRTLIGSQQRSPKSFTWITIDPLGQFTVDALLPTEDLQGDAVDNSSETVERIGNLQRTGRRP